MFVTVEKHRSTGWKSLPHFVGFPHLSPPHLDTKIMKEKKIRTCFPSVTEKKKRCIERIRFFKWFLIMRNLNPFWWPWHWKKDKNINQAMFKFIFLTWLVIAFVQFWPINIGIKAFCNASSMSCTTSNTTKCIPSETFFKTQRKTCSSGLKASKEEGNLKHLSSQHNPETWN